MINHDNDIKWRSAHVSAMWLWNVVYEINSWDNCNCVLATSLRDAIHHYPLANSISNINAIFIPDRERRHIFKDRKRADDGIIRDIVDGKEYKKHMENDFLANTNNISLSLNTDGVAIFKSSKKGELWPLYLVINELPPKWGMFKNINFITNLVVYKYAFGFNTTKYS